MHSGSCLCGGIAFTIDGELPRPDVCHCGQCRKQSGHCFALTDVLKSALSISGGHLLTWFQSSEKVQRGFCSACGSFLFWEPTHGARVAVAMGALDGPTGTSVEAHIFVANKGDYYEIADGVPQRD